MKVKLLILCILFLGIKSKTFSIENPEFVWEKTFTFDSLNDIWIYTFSKFDNNFVIWLEGNTKNNPKTKSSAFIITDLSGNFILQKEYTRTFNATLYNFSFAQKTDKYILNGILSSGEGSNFGSPLKQYQIDESGNISDNYLDTSNTDNINTLSIPKVMYDSIYLGIEHRVYNPDLLIIEYLQKIKVYNKNADFIRDLVLDTTGINVPLEMSRPQLDVFSSNDRHILTTLYGKYDYSNFPIVKNDFILVCKYDVNGKLIWKCRLDQSEFDRFNIQYIYQTNDGSYFVHGYLYTDDKDTSGIYFAKISSNGEKLYSTIKYGYRYFGNSKSIRNGKYFVIYGKRNDYIKPEFKSFWMTIVDANGTIYDEYEWSTVNKDNNIVGIAEKENGNLVVLGRDGWDSLYFAEIVPKFITSVSDNKSSIQSITFSISPNPSNQYMQVSCEMLPENSNVHCKLVDLTGETINEFVMENNYILDTKGIVSGSYYLQFIVSKTSGEMVGNYSKLINIIK